MLKKIFLSIIMLKNVIRKIKSTPSSVVLFVIILFAAARLIFLFCQRDGHHVDETWSYGFANSYYDPYVFSDSRVGDISKKDLIKNLETWISGDVFNDYISVSSDERFSFDSVLYNKYYDLSPSLYALILHFICSLFPDTFSWTYAFLISLFLYIPSLILVYLVSLEFTNSMGCGYFCLLYYIFSGCGTSNFLYLRVYHLFTFLTLLLLWSLSKLIKDSRERKVVFYCILPFVTIAGAFTHYFFLFIAFSLTLFSVIFLLIKKRIKEFFALGLTMLFSVVIFFALYPTAFEKLFPFAQKSEVSANSIASSYSYPYSWDLTIANRHFFMGTIGWCIDFNIPDLITVCGAIFLIIIILVLLGYLFRNEKWYKNFYSNFKNFLLNIAVNVSTFFKQLPPSLFITLLCSVFCLLIIPKYSSLYKMQYIERYFFPAMSLFLIAFVSVLFLFLNHLMKYNNKGKRIITLLFAILLVVSCLRSYFYTYSFQFRNMKEKELLNELAHNDCYIYSGYPRDLVWLSSVLYESNNIFIETPYTKSLVDDSFPVLDHDCLLLILSDNFLDEEQKAEYDLMGTFGTENGGVPLSLETENDFITRIETESGNIYSLYDEFPTFLGEFHLYKAQ